MLARRRRLLPLFAVTSCFLLLATPVGAAETGRDLEPAPPWIFFPDPDSRTAAAISELVENSFGDLNKTPLAREILVRRYGLWSVQKLFQVLKEESVESRTWNAALTVYALRDTLGNAHELWPLLPPLVQLAESSAEPYRRTFAALALGSFHSVEFVPAPPRHPDPLLVRQPEEEARRYFVRALSVLGRLVGDRHPHVEVAGALALGKSGAPGARRLLRAPARLAQSPLDRDVTSVEARMATLVAVGLLPEAADDALLVQQLRDEERRIRRAAALAVALQALADPAPAWTAAPQRLLRALSGSSIRMNLADGAEAVFARGVLAARLEQRAEWRVLFDLAVSPTAEKQVRRAAIQCLLFCREPGFPGQVLSSVTSGARLDAVVLAGFLLHLGGAATPEGVRACLDYLGNPGRRPKGKAEWDVRFYAVMGLMRALASGRIVEPERRQAIYAALAAAASKGLVRGPFREALEDVLEKESRAILEASAYMLPDPRVLALERAFVDPHGLLARDLKDVAVVRMNDFMPLMFNVNSPRPGEPGNRDKSEMPRRFLQQCYRAFPYFSRLDLFAARGRRPSASMRSGEDAQMEVRRP